MLLSFELYILDSWILLVGQVSSLMPGLQHVTSLTLCWKSYMQLGQGIPIRQQLLLSPSYQTTAASLSFLSDNSCFSLLPIRQQLLLSHSYQTIAASLSFLQHDAYDSGREFTEFELYISDHHINQGSKLSDLSIINCDAHSMDIELWSNQLF